MVITHFGNGSYRLQSGETSLLLDPESNRLKADIVLKTLIATGEPFAQGGDAATITFPGEYEVKGVSIVGFPLIGESTSKFLKTAYVINWEELKFVFMGHASKPIDAAVMEEFAEPDVLILPAGGGHFLEPEIAAKIARQLEATIVIPSFTPNPEEFLKGLGKKAEPEEKFVFRKKDLSGEKGRPILLVASR